MSTHADRETLPDVSGRFARIMVALYLFVLVLVLIPLTPKPTHDIKTFLTHWMAVALPVWVLIGGWVRKVPFRRPQLFLPLLIAFLGWMAVAWVLAPLKGHSLTTLAEWFALFMIYLAVTQLYRTPGQVRVLLAVVCVAVGLASLYGFAQRLGIDPIPWNPEHLATDVYHQMPSTFGNPNIAAHTLILASLFAVFVACGGRLWLWALPLLGLYAVHQYYTTQRGGAIALCGAALVVACGMVYRRASRQPVRAAVLALITVGIAGIVGVSILMGSLWIRTGSVYPLDLSLLLRYNSYQGASEMILFKPLTGFGPGNYQIENTPFWTPYEKRWYAQKQMVNDHVHNEVFESGVDGGLPLAFLHLALLLAGVFYGLLMACRAHDRDTRRIGYLFAAFFTAFAIDGLFGFNLRSPVSGALFFVIAGMAEGIWSASWGVPAVTVERRPLMGLVWRVIVCTVALLAALLATQVFGSRLLLTRGMGAAQWGLYEESERLLTQGERLAPWDWRFANELGAVCADRGLYEEASVHYLRALECKPYDLPALMRLSFARFNQAAPVLTSGTTTPEEMQAAADALALAQQSAEAALDLCPVLPQPHDTLGRVAFLRFTRLQEIGAPEADVRAALDVMESHIDQALRYGALNQGELLRFLSVARLGLGDVVGAGRALKRAGQSNPEDPITWQLFYQYAGENDRYDEMEATLEGQVSRLVRDPEADPTALAECAYWLGRVLIVSEAFHAEVETAFKTAVQACPDRVDVWGEWTRYAVARGHTGGLIEALSQVRQQVESTGETLHILTDALGNVIEDRARLQVGIDALVQTAESAGAGGEGALPVEWLAPPAQFLFDCAFESGASLTDPGRAMASLGAVLGMTGQWEAAVMAFRRSLEDLSVPMERQQCLRQLAMALFRSGNMEETLALLRDPATGTLNDPVLLELRADTLVALGRTGEARLEYLQVLQQLPGGGEAWTKVRAKLDQLSTGEGGG